MKEGFEIRNGYDIAKSSGNNRIVNYDTGMEIIMWENGMMIWHNRATSTLHHRYAKSRGRYSCGVEEYDVEYGDV